MTISKPSGAEEEYFAREEAARRQREALENAKKLADAEREAAQKLHYMKCPKCGREYGVADFDRFESYFECEDCAVELDGAPMIANERPMSVSDSLAQDEALASASRLAASSTTPGLNPYAAGCLWSFGI